MAVAGIDFLQLGGRNKLLLFRSSKTFIPPDGFPKSSKTGYEGRIIGSCTLALPGDCLQNAVEPDGVSPSTESSPKETVAGLQSKDEFAFTFFVRMNGNAAEDNPVAAEVGKIKHASDNALTGAFIHKPYKVATVLHPYCSPAPFHRLARGCGFCGSCRAFPMDLVCPFAAYLNLKKRRCGFWQRGMLLWYNEARADVAQW